jgi:hypothetical protein
MNPPLVYMAHPVAGDVPGNLAKAKTWLKWLNAAFPDVAFIAPWIVEIQIYDDNDPAQREASLTRICVSVQRCDALIHVGSRISGGMEREARHAVRSFDCTNPSGLPPDTFNVGLTRFSHWARVYDPAREGLGVSAIAIDGINALAQIRNLAQDLLNKHDRRVQTAGNAD